MPSIAVFGATGISGLAALEALLKTDNTQWTNIYAISRRKPSLSREDPRMKHVAADLLQGSEEIAKSLQEHGATDVTHVLFYAYIAKEDENELIDINRKLFRNSLDALSKVSKKLEVILLQTGYKYYGVHKGGKYLAETPFTEDAPRHEGDNFYFVQEDDLRAYAEKNGWKWIVSRPNFIVGESKGNFMSLAITLGQYASYSKGLNKPLIFPGSEITFNLPYDFSTSKHNADFQLYALTNPKAYNQVFNIHDGKPVKWSEIWVKVAQYFDLELPNPTADPAPLASKAGDDIVTLHSASDFAKNNDKEIDQFIESNGLDPESKKHATWEFLDFTTSRTWSDQGSLDRAKAIGFDKTVDTWEEGFKPVFDAMRAEKTIV